VPEPTIGSSVDPRVRALLPDAGPTYDEVKQHQRSLAEFGQCALEVVIGYYEVKYQHKLTEKGIDLAADATKHFFGYASAAGKVSLVGHALGYLMVGLDVTEKVYDLTIKKLVAEGKEQAAGLDRDQKNLALLMIVQMAQPDALPDGFFLSEVSRVLGTAGKAELFKNDAFKKASALLGQAETSPELARSRDILVASMREGIAAAYQMGIDSEEAFKKLRDTDGAFRARFSSDPAFRAGINSVVWQATFHRDEFDTAVALTAACRAPATRM
jgi:hypothetical protein